MPSSFKSRLIAASLHFLASLTLFALLFFIVIQLWYPQPHFSASGGWQGLIIIALVDLVLGPLLTLIIYNITKPRKELVLDLSIIVIIQLSALFYGIHTVYSQRPTALVFWESQFYTVPATVFQQLAIDTKQLKTFSPDTPTLIYAAKPGDVAGLTSMLTIIREQHIPPFQQVGLYRTFAANKQAVLQHSIDINTVITANANMAQQLRTLLTTTKTQQADNYYLVLASKYQNIILVFNAEAKQIGFLKAPYK